MNNLLAKPELTVQEVVSLVEKRLAPYQPTGYRLEVLPNVAHRQGRWWYVVVTAGKSGVRASDYNTRVEKVERDLKRLDNLSVGILPVVPDWMDVLK